MTAHPCIYFTAMYDQSLLLVSGLGRPSGPPIPGYIRAGQHRFTWKWSL